MNKLYKLACIISFLIVGSSGLLAQTIENSDFEDWSWTIWTLEPDHWTTGNQEVNPRVVPDSMAYSGVLAMKVLAVPAPLGAYGEASQTLETGYIPESLQFYAKWEETNGAVGVRIDFYNNDILQYTNEWFAETDQSPWQLITLPLDQIEPVLTHATITVVAHVGDLVAGDAWISIDDMSFGGVVNGVDELDPFNIVVGPNPATDFITISSPENLSDAEILIVDATGKIVLNQMFSNQVDVSDLAHGSYQLVVSQNQNRVGKKLIVLR